MGDVKRIGYIAEELAKLLQLLADHLATCANNDHQWEHHKNDHSLIKAVHPEVCLLMTSHSWHCLTEDDYQCAPPETTLHSDELDDAA